MPYGIRDVMYWRAKAASAHSPDFSPRLEMRMWGGQRRIMGTPGRIIRLAVEITLTEQFGTPAWLQHPLASGQVRFGQGGCGNEDDFRRLAPPWVEIEPVMTLTHEVRTVGLYTWRVGAQARDLKGALSNTACDYIVVEGRHRPGSEPTNTPSRRPIATGSATANQAIILPHVDRP